MISYGHSVGFILVIVWDLFWFSCRIYFGYILGFILAIG